MRRVKLVQQSSFPTGAPIVPAGEAHGRFETCKRDAECVAP